MSVATRLHQLILIGGGHAHVQVLKAFAANPPANCRLTLVTAETIALYSGMAPGFVAGDYMRDDLSIDLRLLAAGCGARVIEATCERVDPKLKRIVIDSGESLTYDVASFNIGSTLLGRDLPGIGEYALPTRPLTKLIDGVGGLIERARTHSADRPFHLLVVGAGVAGIELAFTAQSRLTKETGRTIHATLLNSGPQILPRYPGSLVRRVKRLAERRGISLCNNARAMELCDRGVILESGSLIPADATFWVTGPFSHPLFANSPGIETDDRGFAWIRSTLQFKNHDDLFAVGDCGTLSEYPHTPKAGVYAVRQGPFITHNLRAQLCGEPLRRYKPQPDFLTLLNMGDGYAIGCKRRVSFGGTWVLRLKDRIDRAFMQKYKINATQASDQAS